MRPSSSSRQRSHIRLDKNPVWPGFIENIPSRGSTPRPTPGCCVPEPVPTSFLVLGIKRHPLMPLGLIDRDLVVHLFSCAVRIYQAALMQQFLVRERTCRLGTHRCLLFVFGVDLLAPQIDRLADVQITVDKLKLVSGHFLSPSSVSGLPRVSWR